MIRSRDPTGDHAAEATMSEPGEDLRSPWADMPTSLPRCNGLGHN